MKKFALIVAGGSGSRMNNNIPKQFIEINSRPLLMHTFDTFFKYDPNLEFILVLPQEHIKLWNSLCNQHQFNFNHKIAFGGKTRFQSVKSGLDMISEEGIVFIHDGVRPLVSIQTLNNCFETAVEKGNALPVIPVTESVRIKEDKTSRAVDRSKYFLVQTPQTFRTDLILNAYKQTENDLFTDDASVLENLGETIHLVEGNRGNIKITFPEDLILAGIFLDKKIVY
jgi:2-C-methyl-D-erythritol 4-phosphate cytidylyltransferase